MELTIAQILTRPTNDGRLSLEITMGSGVLYQYDISSDRFYRALKEILVAENPKRTILEPASHPSSYTDIPSPS